MVSRIISWMGAGAIAASTAVAAADTDPYFEPLTESAPVTMPNSPEELTAAWVVPEGVSQTNLTSMREIEADPMQSVGRAPDIAVPGSGEQDVSAGSAQSMWDMAAYDPSGRFIFNPHESPWSAGLSRYDTWTDKNELLWAGDGQGVLGDWSNDWGAFDPAIFTTHCTVFTSEEWTAEGRVMETMNPFAPVEDIEVRELESIANVAHEGTKFSADGRTLYYIDEWRSGSIYKFVMMDKRDYTVGQTFVLVVDDFAGNPADLFSDESNEGQPRTGMATWVPITDYYGNPTTVVDPFLNGPTNDPRCDCTIFDVESLPERCEGTCNQNSEGELLATRGGRPAADEVNGTPYGRPEDIEISRLANRNEVVYFTATSENSIYSIEMLSEDKAMVRLFAGPETPTNVGFPATTGVLNSPDNLALDALGNIYIIEDAPNSSDVGGDIWFARDRDDDGVAESLDHFMSLRVDGSESTGMIFNPQKPTEYVVNVQHPDSTNLDNVPDGFGDALWVFDVSYAADSYSDRRILAKLRRAGARALDRNWRFIERCERKMRRQMDGKHADGRGRDRYGRDGRWGHRGRSRDRGGWGDRGRSRDRGGWGDRGKYGKR